jgi:hypothetical protein
MPVIITMNKDDVVDHKKGVEKLPKVKNKNGYTYTLVKRNKKAAMYSMKSDIIPEEPISFEVFQIHISKPCAIQQKSGEKKGMWYHYPSCEKFPGNEDFGKMAWAYSTQGMAEKKFQEVSN